MLLTESCTISRPQHKLGKHTEDRYHAYVKVRVKLWLTLHFILYWRRYSISHIFVITNSACMLTLLGVVVTVIVSVVKSGMGVVMVIAVGGSFLPSEGHKKNCTLTKKYRSIGANTTM